MTNLLKRAMYTQALGYSGPKGQVNIRKVQSLKLQHNGLLVS